ncbi:hypothetical protein A8924_5963 [Saccharopolyspora erythraea NRRL 2338]|uniref:Uncharacterized protein n=2 Tax=Saccharopolyspora erythraea TaxID=1836 RepID=A4FL84_SACEN|nr:DUF1349 domain-containing protein [Saccharopolyspora erythraea]EQD85217.1 hypothetical protein N599_15970 [Saccharopolyspora erythraea D]PFG98449.1 hypothetical protein A8924_5963 [Saccharopolyspora erythraea NRRL 2338]QRK88515.1 DUF1349 domain-containing protein [Saccharopolyspora erythraea]CAM04809.1 hypothetical protein SACE_5623 [Saccharopolyspora erythraea NRRL 2338]
MERVEDQTLFGFQGWRWLNPPENWLSYAGLTATADGGTDFWRTTHYGFVRDTGHALLRPVGAEFRLTTRFFGDYREQYDQAGLLLRIDEANWIKTGIEYVDGEQLLSAVVTRDVSDWNVVPLQAVHGDVESVTIEMHRSGDTVTIRYAPEGEEPRTVLRLAYFPPDVDAEAGPMCASPDGSGFPVRFSDLTYAEG